MLGYQTINKFLDKIILHKSYYGTIYLAATFLRFIMMNNVF